MAGLFELLAAGLSVSRDWRTAGINPSVIDRPPRPGGVGAIERGTAPYNPLADRTEQADLVGQATVDGNTTEIHGRRVRLHGVDAARIRTDLHGSARSLPLGQPRAPSLADHIGRRMPICEQRDTYRYGRTVAVCRAEAMISARGQSKRLGARVPARLCRLCGPGAGGGDCRRRNLAGRVYAAVAVEKNEVGPHDTHQRCSIEHHRSQLR